MLTGKIKLLIKPTMINRIRSRHEPVQLKDGFYVEVCKKGMKTGIKIHCEDKQAVDKSILLYAKFKTVVVLGEYKNGIPLGHSYTYSTPAITKPVAHDGLVGSGQTKLWINTGSAPRRAKLV
jgi:hypothetical protein